MVLDEGIVDGSYYTKNVLPVTLKYGNDAFGDKWIFQQNGANLHQHHLTEERCQANFPSLIDKDRGASNQSRSESSGSFYLGRIDQRHRLEQS